MSIVNLRRNEHADMPVLSSNEKYRFALAALEPLLIKLSNLSSEKYYKQLLLAMMSLNLRAQ